MTIYHNYQAEEKPKNNLGDLARKMRLELELGEKKKREQEALAKKEEEEKVVKEAAVAEEVVNQQVTYFWFLRVTQLNYFGHQAVFVDEFVECTISFSLTSEHLRQLDTSDVITIQPAVSEVQSQLLLKCFLPR